MLKGVAGEMEGPGASSRSIGPLLVLARFSSLPDDFEDLLDDDLGVILSFS